MLSRTRRGNDSCIPGVSESWGEKEENSTLIRFFEALTDIFTDVALAETEKREHAMRQLAALARGRLACGGTKSAAIAKGMAIICIVIEVMKNDS